MQILYQSGAVANARNDTTTEQEYRFDARS